MAAATTEWWYKNKEGEKTGPLPLDLLEALWLSGEIDGLTSVWKEGMEDYASISAVDELRSYFQSIADEEDEEDDGEGAGPANEEHIEVVKFTGKQLWDMQWASTTTPEGKTYYANKYTFESSWEPPQTPTTFDDEEAAKVRAPWMLCWTAKGEKLWLNTENKEQQPLCPFALGPAFIAAEKFEGSKPGYSFKKGDQGVGYYADEKNQVTAEPAAAQGKAETNDAKKKKKKKNKPRWKKIKDNTYVYVQGLPVDTTMEEVATFFRHLQFGVLKPSEEDGKTPKIKLYRDEDGNLKGDARIAFLKAASIPLIADGSNFRDDKYPLKVQPAQFQMKGQQYVEKEKMSEEAKKERQKRIQAIKKQERALDWGADEGIDDGRGLRIVILKNMFTVEEMKVDAEAAITLQVTIFDRNPEGVVAIKFKQATSAEECIEIFNGRFFGGRKLTCEF
ncbi:hypothetical protein GUITHDRAFT_149069, partial [Guillardia theta CCMP2712]